MRKEDMIFVLRDVLYSTELYLYTGVLLYNVALLSTEQQSESAMHMYRLHTRASNTTL